ncbi:LON peptidase substrate-binding domain-containing protein [Niveispirillum cyanobacteriorum]|uniref:Peptidase S16 n=1 Tax=Niveispirillum cyanobacteriorum TaxID=1612173 RepID=A0A2K9NC61_9PROT|nr:LON peptidase substrate-binding domain-containing protein [Niveispirillum cyanobacteriorum]AUN30679.1 peptidase S16 [Niveispirillum cyanobacteriorum]GGE52404.1 ATP-dependent protease [Niveispirillum cyanobacteriorum]
MSQNPFDLPHDQLPDTIPVFPLTGVLLLPRGKLPLNIFEPRYLNMVQDALASNRLIGMIQPRDGGMGNHPPLYDIGCVGRITSFSETEDGRFLITLTGISRFRIAGEVPTTRGYRRIIADWSTFAADLDEDAPCDLDRASLDGTLRAYFKQQGISANWDSIAQAPLDRLITSLAMICPFDAPEKQALLESPDLNARAKLLLALVEMAVHQGGDNEGGGARH